METKSTKPDIKPKSSQPLSSAERELFNLLIGRHQEIKEFLEKVIREADSSNEHFALLLQVAYKSTAALSDLSTRNPDRAKILSRRMQNWPVLAAPLQNYLTEIKTSLEVLQVGKDFYVPVNLKKLRRTKTPAREWALQAVESINSCRRSVQHKDETNFHELSYNLILNPIVLLDELETFRLSDSPPEINGPEKGLKEVLADPANRMRLKRYLDWRNQFQIVCSKLPQLSTATVKQWAPVVKMWINHVANDRPENHRELQKLGGYRKEHYVGLNARRSEDANVRDGIFTKIMDALKSIAKDP